jgi:peptidoglycan-associated lipoprotein
MDKKLAFALVLTLAACAHKPEAKKDTSPTNEAKTSAPSGDTAKAPTSCTRDLDCPQNQLCIRNQCVDISAGLAECTNVRVPFPFNSSEIAPEAGNVLERSARCLKADRALHVTIEGNADERGTEEYNLALGDKRATAIATYLERLGASKAQLSTVSYGKENPLCVEHDEACWAKNRRGELKQTAAKGPRK